MKRIFFLLLMAILVNIACDDKLAEIDTSQIIVKFSGFTFGNTDVDGKTIYRVFCNLAYANGDSNQGLMDNCRPYVNDIEVPSIGFQFFLIDILKLETSDPVHFELFYGDELILDEELIVPEHVTDFTLTPAFDILSPEATYDMDWADNQNPLYEIGMTFYFEGDPVFGAAYDTGNNAFTIPFSEIVAENPQSYDRVEFKLYTTAKVVPSNFHSESNVDIEGVDHPLQSYEQ